MDFTDDEDSIDDRKPSASAQLPSSIPLQTKKIRRQAEVDSLTPGSHLLECNGSDIHLARGAAAVPTSNVVAPPPKQLGKASKTKHRYLIVWPGILSLNPKRNQTNDTTKKDEDSDSEEAKKTVSNAASIGNLEGLDTDHPTLKIPFGGGDKGHLTFEGRKVQSSSKFMMLNCAKKGTVTCKNIFTSVIVFGDATFHGKTIPKANKQDIEMSDSDDGNDDKKKAVHGNLRHYGGSDRTVDGGKMAKGLARGRVKPSATFEDSDSDDGDGDLQPASLVSTKKKLVPLTVDDSSDDDSDAYKATTKDTATARRKTPRRSTSQKQVKYDEGDSSSEEEEENSSNDEEAEKKPAAKAKRTTSKPTIPEDSDRDDEEEEEKSKVAKKGVCNKGNAKKPTVIKSDDSDSDSDSKSATSDSQPNKKDSNDDNDDKAIPTRRAPSRTRSATNKVDYVDLDDSDEESEASDEEKGKRKQPAKKVATKAKPNKKKPDRASESSSDDSSTKATNSKKQTSKGRKEAVIKVLSSGASDSDSESEEEAKKTTTRKRGKASSAKSSAKGSSSTSRRASNKPKKEDTDGDRSDASDDTQALIAAAKKPATKSARRKKPPSSAAKVSMGQTKVASKEEASDDSDDTAPKQSRKKRGRQRGSGVRTSRATANSSDSDDDGRKPAGKKIKTSAGTRPKAGGVIAIDSSEEDESIGERKGESSGVQSRRAKASAKKDSGEKTVKLNHQDSDCSSDEENRKSSVQSSAKSSCKRRSHAEPHTGKNDRNKESPPREDSSVAKSGSEGMATPIRSPPKSKRRRKSSSTKKKPKRLSIQDLTNDDAFNFLG